MKGGVVVVVVCLEAFKLLLIITYMIIISRVEKLPGNY